MTVSEDARAVERVTRSLYTAIETADLDVMGALWLDSDDVVCVHPGWPALHGRSAVMRSWAVVMAGATYVQFFLTDLQATIDGDTAVVTCGESVLTAGEEGAADSFVGARAVSTKVLRRTPGGWRVTLHHSSPVLAPSEDVDSADDGDTGSGRGAA